MKNLFKKYKNYKKALHLENLRKKCIPFAYGDILEICSGIGVNYDYYTHDKISSITVVDKNLDYLIFSKNIVEKDVFNKFIFKNDEALNFIDSTKNSYDSVILPLCLCVFDDPSLIVKKVIRILKNDGLIISFQHGSSKFKILRIIQHKLDSLYRKKYGCHLVGDYNKIFTMFNDIEPVTLYKKYAGIFHVAIYKKISDPHTMPRKFSI